ncbi:cystatin-like isoform X1 [Nerophis lumbriciformis]|uniref:cystatin-like isoform X1 n=1 Tax=Nerophis lumbriciformis TaxID=546530 RepID=UPI002ADF48E5|nr:cystatin-C-like [Nerophis lumbriciformis]
MDPLWKHVWWVHTMFVWACVLYFVTFVGNSRATMTGQPRQVPVTDLGVVAAARFAVSEFNRVNPEEHFFYRIFNITSAKVQVVVGLKYFLDVELVRTVVCTNMPQTCPYHFLIKGLQCNFIVTEIPWQGSYVLSQTKCQPLTS